MQHLSTIVQCGNCGLAKRGPLILNSCPARILGTSISIMTRSLRIAISIAAIAIAAPFVGTTDAFSQASSPASQAAPTPPSTASQAPAAQVTVPTPPKPVTRAPVHGAVTTAPASESGRPYVYLLRGLMNIFSLG